MQLSIHLLATKSELLMDGLLMMVVGMGVVFFALTLIMCMLLVMRALPWLQDERPSATPKAAASVASTSKPINPPKPLAPLPASDDGIAPEIVAVISAAVIAIAGANARVRNIRLVRPNSQSPWAGQGRSRQHQSHRMHRGKR